MAQTFPTHAVLGVTVAQAMLTTGIVQIHGPLEFVLALSAGVFGGGAPDTVMLPEYYWDKYVKRIQPMTEEGPVTMFLKEVTHSVFTWAVAIFLWSMFFPAGEMRNLGLVFLFCALFAGVVPDVFTHTEERFRKTDPTFLYPISHIVGIRIRCHKPEWEYRKAHGDRSKKEWEKSLNFWVSVIFLVLFLMYFI